MVFTVPRHIGAIAYQNKALLYDMLFKATAQTLCTSAADRKHLGTRAEFTRRFLLHVLPSALQRIGHCGLLANRTRLPSRLGSAGIAA